MSEHVVFKNLDSFNKSLDNFAQKTVPEAMQKFLIWVGMTLLKGIVKKNPVDTGRSQGNWQVTFHKPAMGKIESYTKDPGPVLRKGFQKLKSLKKEGVVRVIYITNNVDYILELEEGRSGRAPNGMVSVTLQEMQTYLSAQGLI